MMLKHKCIQEFKATRQNKQNNMTVTVQNVTPIKYIRSPKSNTAPEAESKNPQNIQIKNRHYKNVSRSAQLGFQLLKNQK